MIYKPNDIIVNMPPNRSINFAKVESYDIVNNIIRVNILETDELFNHLSNKSVMLFAEYCRLATEKEIKDLNKRLTFK